MAEVVFDLRRITTAVSPAGRVHICLDGGTPTLCGYAPPWWWGENLGDRQPDCRRCIPIACLWDGLYPFEIRESESA